MRSTCLVVLALPVAVFAALYLLFMIVGGVVLLLFSVLPGVMIETWT